MADIRCVMADKRADLAAREKPLPNGTAIMALKKGKEPTVP